MSKSGNRYICLAVDAHIKFLWYAATSSVDEISTAIFLFREIVCKVGPVEQIMSDQGACFESNVFQHLCKLIGSKKLRSSAFHPSGNGGIEVINKTIKPNLAKYVSATHDDWDLHLGLAVNAYNNTMQSSIGMSPSEALFNRPPVIIADIICNRKLPSDTNTKNISDFTLGLWQNAQWVRREVSANKEMAQEKQRHNYDKSVKDRRVYVVGDLVKIKNFKKPQNACSAFVQKFVGPFKITKKLSELSYELMAPKVKNQVVHYNRLLPFYARDDLTDEPSLVELVEPKNGPIYQGSNALSVNNLDNLTTVVVMYKKKLRQSVAADLLIDMENQVVAMNELMLNEVNDPLIEDNDEGGAFGANDGEEVVADPTVLLINGKQVSQDEWLALEVLSREIHHNNNGKKQALCWKCEQWFEEKTGLRVQRAKCSLPMPVRVDTSLGGIGRLLQTRLVAGN
jgi:hypothetical protein